MAIKIRPKEAQEVWSRATAIIDQRHAIETPTLQVWSTSGDHIPVRSVADAKLVILGLTMKDLATDSVAGWRAYGLRVEDNGHLQEWRDEFGNTITDILLSTYEEEEPCHDEVCGECGDVRSDDARVEAGMKCGVCAYG